MIESTPTKTNQAHAELLVEKIAKGNIKTRNHILAFIGSIGTKQDRKIILAKALEIARENFSEKQINLLQDIEKS